MLDRSEENKFRYPHHPGLPLPFSLNFLFERLEQPMRVDFISRHAPIKSFLSALRHELRNPHDPGNYSNDWLDQSAASYMLAGYSPQSFLLYYSDMGWRLASRAICPDIVTVVTCSLSLGSSE
ncbi:hypothetical protein TNCV_3790191 [Trichonephila clavipes]|nr:hypothetical protein TNCV_3790191 [Trichonephila clavipes]